jgi:NADH dehydrogenase FAD-containing subunit
MLDECGHGKDRTVKALAGSGTTGIERMEMIARHRKTLAELDAKEVDTHAIQIMLVGLESLLVSHFEGLEKLRRMFAELEGPSQGTRNN